MKYLIILAVALLIGCIVEPQSPNDDEPQLQPTQLKSDPVIENQKALPDTVELVDTLQTLDTVQVVDTVVVVDTIEVIQTDTLIIDHTPLVEHSFDQCVDGVDNDGDELMDCDDPDCHNIIACVE